MESRVQTIEVNSGAPWARKKSLNRHLFKAPSAVLNGLDISKARAEKLLTAELVILCDAIKGIFRCVLSDDGAVLLG
jgi:hypothetical protein